MEDFINNGVETETNEPETKPEETIEVVEVPKKQRKRQPVTQKQRDHLAKCRQKKANKRQLKELQLNEQQKLKQAEDERKYHDDMIEQICNKVMTKMESTRPKAVDLRQIYSKW